MIKKVRKAEQKRKKRKINNPGCWRDTERISYEMEIKKSEKRCSRD